MTGYPRVSRQWLDELLAKHGLKVDGSHAGAGKFCDLYIDGEPLKLVAARDELRAAGVTANITHVTNPEHRRHGKPMLELPSFWNE